MSYDDYNYGPRRQAGRTRYPDPTKKPEDLIEFHKQRIEQIEARMVEEWALAERLGTNDEYPVGSIITFTRNYGVADGIVYTFTAFKLRIGRGTRRGNLWWVSGRYAENKVTWQQLVNNHLRHAVRETDDICFVTELQEL